MTHNDIMITEGFVGLLYENGAYVMELPPGLHKLRKHWFDSVERAIVPLDMRERSLTIKGQEILTSDKVAIRVSLLVYFRVRDAEAAAHNVESYADRIYEDVQLAARRFLASRSLDAILVDRNEISEAVRDQVMGSAAGYGVEILRADVKDLVFPGNLREIMNQVLETERHAEAQLIEARMDAEAQQIRTEADNQAVLARLQATKAQMRMKAEAELERAELQRQAAIAEAEALAQHPQLLRLRELEALAEMAHSGAKFVVGLDRDIVTANKS